MTTPLFHSHLRSLSLVQRGKVRDIYALDAEHMLIVASDRLSAFDVILPTPIPYKGEILTALSNFWFKWTQTIIANHLVAKPLAEILPDATERHAIEGRATLVRKLRPLPIEAIVRGYLAGSGWKDYQETGHICDIPLPPGLQLADKLPTPIYTPSSKAEPGVHDENINFAQTVKLVGERIAAQIRDTSVILYVKARDYAATRGIIIADTKFEFGLDAQDNLILIDEVLTPDSSRFWPIEEYQIGRSPPSFDKQFVRDYLETLPWNKQPPAPVLPPEIVEKTTAKYQEARRKLIGT